MSVVGVVASLRRCVDDVTVDLVELSGESGCRRVVSDCRLLLLSPTINLEHVDRFVPLLDRLSSSTVSNSYSTDRSVVVTSVELDVVRSEVSLI